MVYIDERELTWVLCMSKGTDERTSEREGARGGVQEDPRKGWREECGRGLTRYNLESRVIQERCRGRRVLQGEEQQKVSQKAVEEEEAEEEAEEEMEVAAEFRASAAALERGGGEERRAGVQTVAALKFSGVFGFCGSSIFSGFVGLLCFWISWRYVEAEREREAERKRSRERS